MQSQCSRSLLISMRTALPCAASRVPKFTPSKHIFLDSQNFQCCAQVWLTFCTVWFHGLFANWTVHKNVFFLFYFCAQPEMGWASNPGAFWGATSFAGARPWSLQKWWNICSTSSRIGASLTWACANGATLNQRKQTIECMVTMVYN